ncbi:glycosyltransferase family 25 protein [Cobetia sp. 4B]|uniref:glycosyltransferase family 25 protein n=1 Tax=Cobetia sp. 4B TaxID=2758724 RepID=UPI001C04748D|nr:glycosyltransferase family 25 protein [Cobetia sp. 4B]QWN35855.1 glycosyltransferase family 25 protein [Cobetia sp. 4B]
MSSSNQIPIFVISLSDASERRNSIRNKLDKLKLDYQIIDAVDGRKHDFRESHKDVIDEEWYKKRKGDPLKASEIACSLSHINIYLQMSKNDIKEAIVLEDDAIPVDDFSKFAKKEMPESAYCNITILHIYNQQYAIRKRIVLDNIYSLYTPYQRFLGACGYYIKLSAAEHLYNKALPVWSTSDWPIAIEKVFDAKGIEPPLVNQSNDFDSQIQTYKSRSIPMHVLLGRLFLIPTIIYPSYFGSRWKSLYAWQAVVRRIKVKFFARKPSSN